MHRLRISCEEIGDKKRINSQVVPRATPAFLCTCGTHGFVHFFCSIFPDILHRFVEQIIPVNLHFFTLSTGLIKTTIKENLLFKYIVIGGVA
jgi:hypothetical protein